MRRAVTLQTPSRLALNHGWLIMMLRERIKRSAKLWIGGGDFHNIATLNPAQIDIIIECD
jgi:hypothetical protein